LETTRATWEQEFLEISDPEFACSAESEFPFLVEGECGGGDVRFLYRGSGFFIELHYFDSQSGAFIGFVDGGDVAFPPCFGQTYGPRWIDCSDPVITNVYCGNLFRVGDRPATLP
jgi:hypothetical protein